MDNTARDHTKATPKNATRARRACTSSATVRDGAAPFPCHERQVHRVAGKGPGVALSIAEDAQARDRMLLMRFVIGR